MAFRYLHDDLPSSRTIGRLSSDAFRLYILALSQTDQWGRLPGDLYKLRLITIPSLPWDNDQLDKAVEELVRAGAIDRYSTDDVWVIQIVNFDERQPVTKMKRPVSRYPARTPSSLSHDDLTLSLPLLDSATVEFGACDLGLSTSDLRASAKPSKEPERSARGPARKFDHDEARERLIAGESAASIARSYGVTPGAVSRIMADPKAKPIYITGDPCTNPKFRQKIFDRDGNCCVYCGSEATALDHVIPTTLGGPSEEWNIVASCGPCNLSKGPKLTEAALQLWESRGGDRSELLTRVVVQDRFAITSPKTPANTETDKKDRDREDRREGVLPTAVARAPANGLSVAQTIRASLDDASAVSDFDIPKRLEVVVDRGDFAQTPAVREFGPDDVASFAKRLRGADDGTPNVLADLRRKLPPAAFANAWESLVERRAAPGKPPVENEVRYFVGALKNMLREGTYSANGAAA